MKKLLSIVLVGMLSTSIAFADCKELYKKHKTKVATKSILSISGGTALSVGGGYSAAVGLVVGVFASNNLFMVTGLVLATGAVTGGAIIDIKGVKNGIEFFKKVKAYKLIKQSTIGAGKLLTETAEELSEELGFEVSTAQIAAIVLSGDQEAKYCQDKESLFNYDDILEDVKSNL